MLRNILISVLLITSTNAFAVLGDGGTTGYYVQKAQVDFLTANGSVIYFTPVGETPQNPGNCLENRKAIILGGHPMRSELMSILLTAQSSGKFVKVWVTDCYEGWNSSFPQVSTIHLVN